MKKMLLVVGLLFFVSSFVPAQESGNRIYGYSGSKRSPEVNSGNLLSNGVFTIEASVLTSVKPDAFVAVFGIQEEAETAKASFEKVNSKALAFEKKLTELGVKKDDIYVDFITQNKVYDYETAGDTAQEIVAGFETKKTVAVRYPNRSLFEKIVGLAVDAGIYDLIKVDYIVSDFESVRETLFEEALKVVKKKEARYRDGLGMTIKKIALAREKYDAFYPGERYESYKAFESGAARSNSYKNSRTVVTLRKSSTFFYEALNGAAFDRVLKANEIEPMVQFTVFLQVRYGLI